MRNRERSTAWELGGAAIAGISALGELAGCAGHQALPRTRMGSIPFPGLFTLYTPAEVSDVGPHHSTEWWERPFEEGEGTWGIVYTCRAGFLDIAHIRESIDWTRYMWERARDLLETDGGSHRFVYNNADFELRIAPPPWWRDVPADERAAMLDEAALAVAQRAAYDLLTWHEIATWFGWSTFALIPEDGSAFTYDDTASHLIGVGIGAAVLRLGSEHFDLRAGEELRRTLRALGAQPRATVDRAARAVENLWWSAGVAVRRDIDIAGRSGVKTPWVVTGFAPCAGTEPAALAIPSLKSVLGHDWTDAYELRVTPASSLKARILGTYDEPATPPWISTREFPAIMNRIGAQMRLRWGPSTDCPNE